MVTKKDYVLKVVPLMQKNAKSVLAGHKIPPAILTMLQTRPDVCADLAVFGYNTVNWKKGDKALKKNEQFKITGYKNFMDFSKNSMGDIAKFQETLPAKDKKDFQANENVVTLMIVPDVATGNLAEDIVNLKSKTLTYGKSLDRTYAGLGGIFITVAFGTSYILPKTAIRAEKKENLNKKINLRRTPAKVKQELAQKNKAKLAFLKSQGSEFKTESDRLATQIAQLSALDIELDGSAKNYNANVKADIKASLAELTPSERKMYNDVQKYRSEGKEAIADAIKADFDASIKAKGGSPILIERPKTASELLEERKEKYLAEKEKLEANVKLIEEKIANAPNANVKRNLNYTLRQNVAKIADIDAKLGVHNSVNKIADTIAKKKLAFEKINAKMEENFIAGMTLKDAMNKAVADSKIDKDIVAEISADLKSEVASGMTQEEAIAHVISEGVELVDSTVKEADVNAITVNDGVIYEGSTVWSVDNVTNKESSEYYLYVGVFSKDDERNAYREYFIKKENARIFADEMNATLVNEQNVQDGWFNVNDGVVQDGDKVFGVETDIAEGDVYDYFSTDFNSNSPNKTTEYFTLESNAIDFALSMNATLSNTLVGVDNVPFQEKGTYEINNGAMITEGNEVYYVETNIAEGETYIKSYDPVFVYDENTTKEYFATEDEAIDFADSMNATLNINNIPVQENGTYEINNGAMITEGNEAYYVETNISAGETYRKSYDPVFVYDENTTREYFATEDEAIEFADQMNATLDGEVGVNLQDGLHTVNDGEVVEGQNIFGVSIVEGLYTVYPVVFDSTNTEIDYFVSESIAEIYRDGMNKTLIVEPVVYNINDGEVREGDTVYAVTEVDGLYGHQETTFVYNPDDTETEYFISEIKAMEYTEAMTEANEPEYITYTVEDGEVTQGQIVYAVNTNIADGESYEYTQINYDNNWGSEQDILYFVYEANAIAFRDQMNQTLDVSGNSSDDINDILSFL